MTLAEYTKMHYASAGIVSLALHAMEHGMVFDNEAFNSIAFWNGAIDFNSVIEDDIYDKINKHDEINK